MAVRAYLFDAEGTDREVTLDEILVKNLNNQHLLWVDVTGHDPAEINEIGFLLHLHRESVKNLLNPIGRPRLDNYGKYFQVNVSAVKEVDLHYTVQPLDLFSGPNYIVTVHPEPIEFLENFHEQVRGDTQIGRLNEAAFLAALLEWHVTSYFRTLHIIEEEVDRLDEVALLKRADREFLSELVRLRRRVAEIRRLLTPHREVFAALARPDFEAISNSESAAHFRALYDRLERAIDAVEHSREMVLGSFELFMTGTAQNTNDFVKMLTLATVLIGLIGVIAGIFGMNFEVPFFHSGMVGFFLAIAAMIVLTGAVLAFAWRRRTRNAGRKLTLSPRHSKFGYNTSYLLFQIQMKRGGKRFQPRLLRAIIVF